MTSMQLEEARYCMHNYFALSTIYVSNKRQGPRATTPLFTAAL